MVVGVFPAAKLGALLLRQVSKPIANVIKERSKHNYFFRTYICMPPAQFYNWCEVRMKMYYMDMGKPDSIPRLNEQMAIELGANLLGEAIVFLTAAGLILLEYNRQVRKEELKEMARKSEIEELDNKIRELCILHEVQDAQIRRIMHMFAELESRMVKIPWKSSSVAQSIEDNTDLKRANNAQKTNDTVNKNDITLVKDDTLVNSKIDIKLNKPAEETKNEKKR